jgi:hypothetical protein
MAVTKRGSRTSHRRSKSKSKACAHPSAFYKGALTTRGVFKAGALPLMGHKYLVTEELQSRIPMFSQFPLGSIVWHNTLRNTYTELTPNILKALILHAQQPDVFPSPFVQEVPPAPKTAPIGRRKTTVARLSPMVHLGSSAASIAEKLRRTDDRELVSRLTSSLANQTEQIERAQVVPAQAIQLANGIAQELGLGQHAVGVIAGEIEKANDVTQAMDSMDLDKLSKITSKVAKTRKVAKVRGKSGTPVYVVPMSKMQKQSVRSSKSLKRLAARVGAPILDVGFVPTKTAAVMNGSAIVSGQEAYTSEQEYYIPTQGGYTCSSACDTQGGNPAAKEEEYTWCYTGNRLYNRWDYCDPSVRIPALKK